MREKIPQSTFASQRNSSIGTKVTSPKPACNAILEKIEAAAKEAFLEQECYYEFKTEIHQIVSRLEERIPF